VYNDRILTIIGFLTIVTMLTGLPSISPNIVIVSAQKTENEENHTENGIELERIEAEDFSEKFIILTPNAKKAMIKKTV
jgi:hypothetical protein